MRERDEMRSAEVDQRSDGASGVLESSPSKPQPSRLPLARRLIIRPVRAYQSIFAGRPSPCRFEPSCSQYTVEAVSEYGAFRGSFMGVRRILRCNPWGGFGWDPVPPKQHHVDNRPPGRLNSEVSA